jgi:hypothetical protein
MRKGSAESWRDDQLPRRNSGAAAFTTIYLYVERSNLESGLIIFRVWL